MIGWIKIHKKITEWEWYSDVPVRLTFFHLLITANWEDKNWKGRVIKRGQVVVGSFETPKKIGITRQQFRTAIKKLKSTNEITTISTNKNTILTLVKYEDYQSKEIPLTTNTTISPTIEQPSSNHQATTTKESNNIITKESKEVITKKTEKVFSEDVMKCFNNCLLFFPNELHPKNPDSWLDTIEKLNRIDKYKFPEIEHVVKSARFDDFWKNQFLSILKLRKLNRDKIKYFVVFQQKFKSIIPTTTSYNGNR